MTFEAPAARASATSRGWRTPPSAHTCLPSSRAAAAHSSTAENWGRPTAVIIRVVHMAPGPTPTLTMSAPASMRSRVPCAETTLPGDDGHAGVEGPHGPQRLEHLLLVAVGGVDDEDVGPGIEQVGRLGGDVAVDADRRRDPQPPVVVDGGGVQVSRAARPTG